MKYDLFCDAEWKEPKRLETRHALQIGETVCLEEAIDLNQANHYRVIGIEHVAVRVVPGTYSDVGIPIVTLARISQAELDQGPQPGCATN